MTGEESRQRPPPSLGRRLATWVVGGVAAVVLAVGALVFFSPVLLPRLVDLEAVQKIAAKELHERIPGFLGVARVELVLRPLPRVILWGTRLSTPELSAVIESLAVSLDLRELLHGRVRPTAVRLDGPLVTLRIPETLPESEEPLDIAKIEKKVLLAVEKARPLLGGIALSVARGGLRLHDGKAERFNFRELDAGVELKKDRLELKAAFSGSLAERAEARLTLRTGDWKGEGRLRVTGLRPEALLDYVGPAAVGVAGSAWTGELGVETRGRGTLLATLEARSPRLGLIRRGRALFAKEVVVAGTAEVDGGRRRIALRRLEAASPKLAASGSLAWEPAGKAAALDLAASDLDLAPLRAEALAWAPDVGLVGTLCDIARAGRVDRLTVSSRAATPGALGTALTVRAGFHDATAHIPGADLVVTRGSGTVTVTPGAVSGEHLSCALGGSTASGGAFRLGLQGGDRAPFHLETDVDADLAELRTLLPRWLPRGAVRDELDRVSSASGRATGRLVLGEKLDALAPVVDVRSFDLTARTSRLPFPAQLRGSLKLGGNRLALGGLSGRVGQTTFTGVAGDVTWGGAAQLRVTQGRAATDLGELWPSLLKSPAVRDAAKDFGPPSGRLTVEGVTLSGPANDPSRWTFRANGGLSDVTLRSVLFPGPLQLARGTVSVTEGGVAWSGVAAALLDSSAVLSGRLTGLRSRPRSLEVTGDGAVGPRTLRWAEGKASLKEPLLVAQRVGLRKGRLSWNEKASSFSGELAFEKGPVVTAEVNRTADRLVARELWIKDSRSDVRLTVDQRRGVADVSFQGRLRAETVDALFRARKFDCAEAEGQFRAEILPASPDDSTATGRLHVSGVRVAVAGKKPLEIDDATLVGQGRTLKIESARVGTGPLRVTVDGTIAARNNVYEPRLRVSADELDVATLEKVFGDTPKRGKGGAGAGEGGNELKEVRTLPILGTVAVEIGTLRWKGMVWKKLNTTFGWSGGTLTGDVHELGVCGIDLNGRVEVRRGGLDADVKAKAHKERLEEVIKCLFDTKSVRTTGLLEGELGFSVHGPADGLLRSAGGEVSFEAKDGRIYGFALLARIFGVLSVTEVLRGRLPDVFGEGIPYRTFEGEGLIRKGVLTFRKGHLDGKTVQVFWEGTVDLATQEADLTVLVSPFRTADAVISMIPVVNYLMADRLVAIPVRVRGHLRNPSIDVVDASAVGSELLGFVGRTLKLPFRLLEHLIPESKPKASPPP